MPIYQYNCGSCKVTREYFLPVGKEPSTCEECDERSSFTRVYDGQTLSMQLDSERNGHSSRLEGFTQVEHFKLSPGEGIQFSSTGIKKVKMKGFKP